MFATCGPLKGVHSSVDAGCCRTILPGSDLRVQSANVEQHASLLEGQRTLTGRYAGQRVVPGRQRWDTVKAAAGERTRCRQRIRKYCSHSNTFYLDTLTRVHLWERKCFPPTSGSAHPGFSGGGRSADPGSTAGCSTPSVTPSRSGYGSGCAWPAQQRQQQQHNVNV